MINTPSTPIYSIYLITNLVNNKKYVGFTSKKPQHRWKSHCRFDPKKKTIISTAIFKHGKENFKFEVILQGWDREHVLSMETYFIKEYNTFGNTGYNATLGQNITLGYRHTKETLQKYSLDRTGEKNSMYGKKGVLHPLYGRKLTDGHKLKMSNSRKGKNWGMIGTKHPCSKKYLIELPDGNIKEVLGLREFERNNNLNHGCLTDAFRRKTHHKGYKILKNLY